ncbi:MAG: 30S ribosomal protein S13 [bacterium]|nr:30S ribosomal protein S13 [bacterium]
MARIAGVTIPVNKQVETALQYIYGVGITRARQALAATDIKSATRVKDLTEEEVNRLREYIEKNYRLEGELRRDVLSHVKRLKEIGSYRGARHAKKLPARGQRTKTNSRTVRGNVRRTMGSGKRSLEKT